MPAPKITKCLWQLIYPVLHPCILFSGCPASTNPRLFAIRRRAGPHPPGPSASYSVLYDLNTERTSLRGTETPFPGRPGRSDHDTRRNTEKLPFTFPTNGGMYLTAAVVGHLQMHTPNLGPIFRYGRAISNVSLTLQDSKTLEGSKDNTPALPLPPSFHRPKPPEGSYEANL